MFLCYADESGYSGKGFTPFQPVQVMAAIVANVYNFHRSDSEFRQVLDIVKRDVPVRELKCEQIYRGKDAWRESGFEERDKVIEFYLDWIATRNHKFIVTAIDNGAYFHLRDGDSDNPFVQHIPYPYLLAGLHTALVLQKLHKNKKKNKGRTILIFDEQGEFQDQLTDLIFSPPDFVDDFVPFDEEEEQCRLCQIIDTAFFVKSHHSSMAQVADVVAYLFRLHLELSFYGVSESYEGERVKIANWMRKIDDKFIPFGVVYPKGEKPFLRFLRSVKAKGIGSGSA